MKIKISGKYQLIGNPSSKRKTKMTPVILVGKSLGERHHYLNNIVNEAYKTEKDFHDFESLQENSPVDRIFKINLASKLQNVDYIIKNLKDDDMLYVSKALKSKWLMDPKYEDLINSQYLEKELYPSMKTTAVTKMKRWIFLNLKNAQRCQQFYLYYHATDFAYAVHFLKNCSSDFVKQEFPKIINKISLNNFKILCEKYPDVTKIFFDTLPTDETLIRIYCSQQKEFFNILKSLLTVNADMVLDITEKYFNKKVMRSFNSKATKFIMKHHKERFLQKPELYTAWLLNMKTLGNCISVNEVTDLISKLARTKNLVSDGWFNYKQVEPLIKRLKPLDRGELKKKIFIDKDIGGEIQDLPYKFPSQPTVIAKPKFLFKDLENDLSNYHGVPDFRAMLKKRKFCKRICKKPKKTFLDKLFDEYRVTGFDKVLFELRKKLKAESSATNRQFMMLVLVSKSGGRVENLKALIELLSNYKNEPPQIRAAVVRSLVKRAQVWKISSYSWNQLLEFAHGLGLDGKVAEIDCVEGIHAVVIRQLLMEQSFDSELFDTYLCHFSTFTEYPLSVKEKKTISEMLANIFYTKACEENEFVSVTVGIINKFLDILEAYKLPIKKYTGLITTIKNIAKISVKHIKLILNRLYKSRIGRRELFKANFDTRKTEESYLNALRHDANVIIPENLTKIILDNEPYQNFLLKISIYFSENNGLSKETLNVLLTLNYNKLLAKPLTILLGDKLELYLKELDTKIEKEDKPFAAAIRANIHFARPALDIDKFGWSMIGTKAVANKVLLCRDIELDENIQKLIQNKRTMKLALELSKRKGDFINIFTIFSKIKPNAAIKVGLNILRNHKNASDSKVWDVIKPLLENLGEETLYNKKYLVLHDINLIPIQVKPEYSVIMYRMYKNRPSFNSILYLFNIENLLPQIDENFIENLLKEFLNDFIPNKISDETLDDYIICARSHLRIIIKHLILCESEEIREKKFEAIGVVFFEKLNTWLMSDDEEMRAIFFKYFLKEILMAFVYYKVLINTKYISCISLMEKTMSWIEKHLSVMNHLKSYVHMKLNILYFNAIKSCMENLKAHTIDETNHIEAAKIVGNIFGKYLGEEISDVTTRYFDSAKYLFIDIITCLKGNFIHSSPIFSESMINSILDNGNGVDNYVLAIHLLRDNCLERDSRKEIICKIKENNHIEVQMLIATDTFFAHYT